MKPLGNRIRPLQLAVIALPFLGGWSCVHAGFIALTPVVAVPRGPLSTKAPDVADTDDLGSAAAHADPACEIGPVLGDEGDTQSSADTLPCTGMNAGARRAVPGRCVLSGDSEGGDSDRIPGGTRRPRIDSPPRAGMLFRQASAFLPPPFSSRIFRPPRRA